MSDKKTDKEHNRLSRIYTRGGDKGETSLGEGRRVSKSHPRIEAIGAVDELNTWVGLLIQELKEQRVMLHKFKEPLEMVQHNLFNTGGELAMPGYQLMQEEFTTELETLIDEMNESLPPLKNFILPGGSRLASYCHMARSVARRAERNVIASREAGEDINLPLVQYLNRLSDFFFVLSRILARQTGGEVLWQQAEKKKLD
ncbi:cob(I)yrinic acid a,c-diamide adenosyltransferase [Pelagibaculum spongiae]|uniref:Corrinoid adenosyltransferase n=1 Tax=Pelagibaculum spongiae TaxID=2080658 RepID=A0A2V1GVL3_9GAMM|nr:cob(I)yrinic acid a,c-diamide adenosyltransferase [Pelagibaculum spongiae]PVZ70368.1 cob(I)yrinic acid a,c-diamide adenosyltransferase [Pelagibaculum spongiae]